MLELAGARIGMESGVATSRPGFSEDYTTLVVMKVFIRASHATILAFDTGLIDGLQPVL